ncbi:G-type lectin S-receptor-like serine/threonine-protein kinase LECRK4 [Ricinus communis]|uniref:Receptor-like serine/threonine-protein kinase n=1 Tax=Ricinus communis TaxID=3988 RepID=B9REI0_RICCO|nr:G-type lectin S-receptor-like serine/threonine-protein kinase LECRK4 [Ricinus communis]EEF50183.1 BRASSINOSTEROID INSENSITIVE 1-associated receptor kinase 1 precursor, putative [Ricinus communis]|eukprot:XP_002512149.1 G-type lectin S-receptor-like serine/threonine-protein kinase LECRK4 [Ricinus communis]
MAAALVCSIFFLVITLSSFADAQTDTAKVALGSTLYANDDNSTWTSESGDFSFGFRRFPGQEDQFLLAIWFAKIPDRTIVWSAPAQPVPRGSKVELTPDGLLLLQAPGSSELWSTANRNNEKPLNGAMLDTGNFVIVANASSNIWESFRNPTNTILPTQVLNVRDKLSSTLLEKNFAKGKFELLLGSSELMLRQRDVITGYPYGPYLRVPNVLQLIFNESGDIFTKQVNNTMIQRTEGSFPTSANFYFRATLDFDGTFTEYIHPRNPNGNENWSVVSVIPPNICFIRVDMGGGPCGYNSYCEAGPHGKPKCGCPPGFSILDPNNPYSGCKQAGGNFHQDCNQLQPIIEEERIDFFFMDGADWPFTDYEQLTPSSENECRSYCSRDCNCAVAIFQDPKFNNGNGSCWKKKLPLLNGRLDRGAIDRRALFKVLKENASSQLPPNPNSRKKDQDQVVLILSVLLGTSAFLNFFSVAAISLAIYLFGQRKFYSLCKTSDERDLETNLRSYKYKDLEKATNNFREELGRGAFGTVYKGLLPSSTRNYIAVKKLEKMVQEGQKEFLSEVNTIGQTHHKNLVQLLGYCYEGEGRLLVYEFMQNGSLSSFLFGSPRLNWQQRVQIASGIARGLMYLHEECSKQIIHCDIKPQNILLDDTFTAKISDFGLAKLLINNQTRTLTGIRGTKGYVAPEWFRNTPVSVKVDVYSFGVMLLEIICCRRCVEFEMEKEAILADWAYECYHQGKVETLVLNDQEARSDLKKLEKFVMVALWCVQDEPLLRPSMRTVTLMLEGILEVSVPPSPFSYSSLSSSSLESLNEKSASQSKGRK